MAWGGQAEPAHVAVLGHALLVIDLTVGERGHQRQIELTNLRVLDGQGMEDAVVGLDQGGALGVTASPRDIAQFVHQSGQDFGALHIGAQFVGVLGGQLQTDLATERSQLGRHPRGTRLLNQCRHQELGKPGVVTRKAFVALVGQHVQLLGTPARGAGFTALEQALVLERSQVLTHGIAADAELFGDVVGRQAYLVFEQQDEQVLLPGSKHFEHGRASRRQGQTSATINRRP